MLNAAKNLLLSVRAKLWTPVTICRAGDRFFALTGGVSGPESLPKTCLSLSPAKPREVPRLFLHMPPTR